MPLPDYKYGKVTSSQIYPDLTVMSERSESPMVCCGYCSAGMACRTARTGLENKMSATAHPIRSKGGRPHDAGSNATELRNGAKAAHGITLDSVAISEIPNILRAGKSVEIACDYADLPSYLKVQSGSFGHSVMLYGWKEDGDYVGFFDPLWPQDARGAWAKWSDIKPALWSDGQHNAAMSVEEKDMSGDYVIYDAEVNSRKTGKVAASTPFYNDWQLTDKRGTIGDNGATSQIMGYRGDSYAIQVYTGQGWSDGVKRQTLVFVAKTKVSGIVNAPEPVPATGMESFVTPAKPSTVSVIKGGKLYDNSGFTSDGQTITVDPGPRAMPLIGTVPGGYMVDYVNASGVDQNKAYWVKTADTAGVTVLPPDECPECPPEPDIPAIEKAAKQEEWDAMIAVFPPRP